MSAEAAIVIKKVKKVSGGGHHGGAWKVAYADFVTAMMAFFLLMWLVNATSPEQKQGIADYFAPAAVSESTSGAGGILAGQAFDTEGARNSAATNAGNPTTSDSDASGDEEGMSEGSKDSSAEDAEALQATQEAAQFEQAALSLRQAMKDMPELAELSKNLIIDQTPEGMRIQIVDQEGRPMFPPGGVEPYERTRLLMKEVSKVINRLPNRISISGHTDSGPFKRDDGYTNWELSADRANATRRIFERNGVDPDRIYQVSGKAGSEPLFPDDPYMSANRRISIVLLREAPVLPPNHQL